MLLFIYNVSSLLIFESFLESLGFFNKILFMINKLLGHSRFIQWVDRHRYALIALVMSCYGLFLRLRMLNGRDLWGDEWYQFDNMKGAFKPFWLHQTYGDFTSFPGEYILCYPLVRIFGMNKWWLAVGHLLFTILGFYLLFVLCRRYMRSWIGFTGAFLIYALNFNLVYDSLEFRPYGVLAVLALASLWIAYQLKDHSQNMSLGRKFSIALAGIFIINYHAYGIIIFMLPLIFVLITSGVDLIRKDLSARAFRQLLPWRFLSISLTVAVLIWLWYASSNKFGASIVTRPNIFQYIANPSIAPISFLKGVIGNLLGNRIFYVLLIGCLPIFPHRQWGKQLLFLGILVILPIGLILWADLKSQYWFLQRQFIWVVPFFALWVGWSLDSAYLYIRGHGRKENP